MSATDKPVTFRNDSGRIHAGVPGEDFTRCGRIKRSRNRYTVIPGPRTVTCGECLTQMERAERVSETLDRMDLKAKRRALMESLVADGGLRVSEAYAHPDVQEYTRLIHDAAVDAMVARTVRDMEAGKVVEFTVTPDLAARMRTHTVAGFSVREDPMPLRHAFTESTTHPGIVWPS
jgi:hypothetical protein